MLKLPSLVALILGLMTLTAGAQTKKYHYLVGEVQLSGASKLEKRLGNDFYQVVAPKVMKPYPEVEFHLDECPQKAKESCDEITLKQDGAVYWLGIVQTKAPKDHGTQNPKKPFRCPAPPEPGCKLGAAFSDSAAAVMKHHETVHRGATAGATPKSRR